jgi:hypothetical protein
MKSQLAGLALALVLLLAPGISHAQTPISCSTTVFEAPPSDPQAATFANGVNRWGNVVGFTFITELPFIRHPDGGFEVLPIHVSGFIDAIPSKRNAFGVTVGKIQGPDGHSHGFVNSGTDTVVVSIPGAVDTFLTGINRYGTIVGNFKAADGTIKSFKIKNGKTTMLQFRTNTQATSISDTGVIVGNTIGTLPSRNVRGFVLMNGQFHDLDFPGATFTSIADINATGTIVGRFITPTGGDNFFFKNGKFFVPTLHPSSKFATPGTINGINGFGDITGNVELIFPDDPSGTGTAAFVGKRCAP